ncbi:MAG: T9SS type A sorting domain-containing protein [Chitinophagales bacterium]
MKKLILLAFVLSLGFAKAQSITPRGTNICDSFTVDFSDTSSGLFFHFVEEGYTPNGMVIQERRWYFGDPGSDTANTSKAIQPDHMFSAPGTYTVCLAADAKLPGEPGGQDIFCYDSICKTVVVLASVINDEPLHGLNKFYPNPAQNYIAWNGQPAEISEVILYDIHGKECFHILNPISQLSLPTKCPNGIYFLYYKTREGIQKQKITIQR